MRFVVVFAAFALLAGCTLTPQEEPDGPYYTEGFADGCRTAEARRAAFDNRSYRNDELFAAQASYRSGWRQGFRECQPVGTPSLSPTPEGAADRIL